jgi:aldehyde dehydrogenase (NAD+)
VVWKPSEKTPLTALATQALFERAAARFGGAPAGLSELIIGGRESAKCWSTIRVPLISRHRLDRMGARGRPAALARRFARALLELGGNNAMIVAPSPIWTWPCAASCSPRSAPPASAAPRCAGCSCMRSVYDDARRRLKRPTAVAIGDPASRRRWSAR